MRRYYSYREGNGPWHIFGERKQPKSRDRGRATQRFLDGRDSFQAFMLPGGHDLIGDTRAEMPECDGSAYSDRMWQWDHEKMQRCTAEHIGGPFYRATEEQMSAFLSAYFDKPLKFVALWQGNNAASGYEYYLFFWREAA